MLLLLLLPEGNVNAPYLSNVQLRVPETPMINVAVDADPAPLNGPFVTVIISPGEYPVPATFIAILAYPLPASLTFTVSPVPVPPVVARLLP
jgi:hypothetical protein